MDRAQFRQLWDEAWNTGLWAAAWSKAVDGLTPAQATWRPAPGRHSIAQLVAHMTFWREAALQRAAGGQGPTEAESAAGNFPELASPSETVWHGVIDRFRASQERVKSALADERADITRIPSMLAHDSYHIGQIMYVRALQELPPIE